MENKENRTRVCKYIYCRHKDKIHIDTEPFVKKKNNFYHEDCYKEKADLQLFRSMWSENINPTVVFSDLNRVLSDLIVNRGLSSDYLLFVLQYVIDNHCKLNYPAGFRYYIDNKDIKAAYEKKHKKIIPLSKFTANDDDANAPKFSVNRKPIGFNSILGG